METNIRLKSYRVGRKDEVTIDIPKGYAAIITTPTFLGYGKQSTMIVPDESTSVKLSKGWNHVCMLSEIQDIEFTKVLYIKSGKEYLTLTFVMNAQLTRKSLLNAKILGMYSMSDPGVFKELHMNIGTIINAINEMGLSELTPESISKIKRMIESSALRVITDYAMVSPKFSYIE